MINSLISLGMTVFRIYSGLGCHHHYYHHHHHHHHHYHYWTANYDGPWSWQAKKKCMWHWQWLMSVLCVRNLNNTKKKTRKWGVLRAICFWRQAGCCVPSLPVKPPFALNKQIQSSFHHGEWWREPCLHFVSLLMESLTVVRGIKHEEHGFRWRRGDVEGGGCRTKKTHPIWKHKTPLHCAASLIAATKSWRRVWESFKWSCWQRRNDAEINRSVDDYTRGRTIPLSWFVPRRLHRLSQHRSLTAQQRRIHPAGSGSNVSARVAKVTNPSPGIVLSWGHGKGLLVTFL